MCIFCLQTTQLTDKQKKKKQTNKQMETIWEYKNGNLFLFASCLFCHLKFHFCIFFFLFNHFYLYFCSFFGDKHYKTLGHLTLFDPFPALPFFSFHGQFPKQKKKEQFYLLLQWPVKTVVLKTNKSYCNDSKPYQSQKTLDFKVFSYDSLL